MAHESKLQEIKDRRHDAFAHKYHLIDLLRMSKYTFGQKMAQIAQQRIAADSPFLMLEGTQPGAREEMEQLIAKSIGKTPDFVSDVGCAVAINSGQKMLGIGFLLNEGEE